MKRRTEIKLAESYLGHRKGGYSIAKALKTFWWIHLLLIILALILTLAAFHVSRKSFIVTLAIGAGLLLGGIIRDCGWFRRAKMCWPFIEKITDWKVVEELSKEKKC